MNWPAAVIALLAVAITWIAAGRMDRRARALLATLNKSAQVSWAKEGGNMDHKASVAALLGSAAGAAEALMECGIECDDTELVADFIAAMENAHAMFSKTIEQRRNELLQAGLPDLALNDMHTTIRLSMQHSPACTNMHFMWRLGCILKRSASPDVLEAARGVVFAHGQWDRSVAEDMPDATQAACLCEVERAVAKLAAALPKEV